MNRNFLLLWMGQSVSGFGTSFFTIAMVLWLKDATGSTAIVGALLMAATIPGVLLGPFSGAIADRYSRRKIIIYSDVVNGFAILGLSAVIFLRPTDIGLIIGLLFVVAVISGALNSVFGPSVSAALPDLVPRETLLRANSIRQITAQTIGILGQSLGGLAYVFFGGLKLFVFNGLSFLFSAFTEVFLEIPQAKRDRSANEGLRAKVRDFLGDASEGVKFIWRQPGMRLFFLGAAAVNFLVAPFSVLLPFHVDDFLKASPAWFGYLLGAITLGNMAGLVFYNLLQSLEFLRKALLVSLLPLLGMTIAAFGVALNQYAALGFAFALGVFSGIFNLNVNTILQLTTPTEIRGRVFGLLSAISMGAMPISMGLAGIIADQIDRDIPLFFRASGLLLIAIALLLTINAKFRQFLFTPATAAEDRHEAAEANPMD